MKDLIKMKFKTSNDSEINIQYMIHSKQLIVCNELVHDNMNSIIKDGFFLNDLEITQIFDDLNLAFNDLFYNKDTEGGFRYVHLLGVMNKIIEQLPFLKKATLIEFGLQFNTTITTSQILNNTHYFFGDSKVKYDLCLGLLESSVKENYCSNFTVRIHQ